MLVTNPVQAAVRLSLARLARKPAPPALCTAALLLGVSLNPTSGSAQEAPVQRSSDALLQEIVVTATRSATELSKVPVSVTAYTQDQLDAAGVKSVADLTQLTPGLNYVSSTYGGFESTNISIRGIDSQAGAATTAVYIDDTPIQQFTTLQAFNGQPFPKIFDLERVEVLKGPQGTLFGAGAEGGAIRFITPQPGLEEYSGFAKTEYGQTQDAAASYEAGAAFGGPIVADTLGFRVSGWYRRDGGYVDRTSWETGATSPNANDQEAGVLRGALRWRASDSVEITPSVFYQNIQRSDTSYFWTSLSDPGNGRLVSGNALAQPSSDRQVLPGVKIEAKLPSSLLLTVNSSYFNRLATGTLDVTNFFPIAFGSSIYPTYPPNFTWASVVETTQHGVTEEVRLQTTDAQARLRWLVGLFYESFSQRDMENDQAPLLSQLPGAVQPFDNPNTAFVGTQNSQSSMYASLDYRLTDTLTATAGVRAEHSRVSTATSFSGALYYGNTTATSGVQSQNPITPKVGLSWQPTDDNLVYANVSTGYRDGGVNPPLFGGCNTGFPVKNAYGSDRTTSYELGTKDKLADGRIQFEASLYDVQWKHIQTAVYLPCGVSYTFDGGEATVHGAEFAARALLVEGLSAGLSVTYTHTKYDNTISEGFGDLVVAGTSVGDPKSANVIPPWAVVMILDYTRDIASHASFIRLQDSFRSRDKGPFTSQNPAAVSYDPTLPIDPSTNILGLRVGTRFASLETSVFVDNLTNSQPILRVQHDFASSPLYYASTFRPRTYGLTLNYKF